jgi:type VI secretion system protein ImpF
MVSSIMDRLLGVRQTGDDSPRAAGQYLSQLKLSVRADLENLLNTRWRCTGWPQHFRELNPSLVNYGLPDFTGLNMSAPAERERIRLELERAIRRFEPRLKDVAVTVHIDADRFDRTLRFRITGALRTEPVPERVVFDSELKTATATIEVTALS